MKELTAIPVRYVNNKRKKILKTFLPLLYEIEYKSIVKQDLQECLYPIPNVKSLVGRNFDFYDYYYVPGKNGGLFSYGLKTFAVKNEFIDLIDLQYIVAKKPHNGFGTWVVKSLLERYPNRLFLINSIDDSVSFYEKFGFQKECLAKDWKYLKYFTVDAFSQPNSWILLKHPIS